jgi:hypothetical protein
MSDRVCTCAICSDKFVVRSNGVMVSCKCGVTSVDYTPEYTRFVGLRPLEEMSLIDRKYFKKLRRKIAQKKTDTEMIP